MASSTQSTPNTSQKRPYKKKRQNGTYNIYILRVLEQVHPEIKISNKALSVMDNMVKYIFERIASEAARLVQMKKAKTMQKRDIESAARLILGKELARYVLTEAEKAYRKYYGIPIIYLYPRVL